MNRINKRVDSTTRRRFNICFHSKISKPKCSKTQRALARPSAQLQYGFSMWTRTFIYKVWTQTKRWKRPWLLDKFILCCFTLHSATNTPGIHKCYWIVEGVNKTQKVEQHSRRIWSLLHQPACGWRTRSSLILAEEPQEPSSVSEEESFQPDDHQRPDQRDTLGQVRDVEVLQVRPSSGWWRLNQSLLFVRMSRFHEPETVKSVFLSFQINFSSIQVKVLIKFQPAWAQLPHQGGGGTATPERGGCQPADQHLTPGWGQKVRYVWGDKTS